MAADGEAAFGGLVALPRTAFAGVAAVLVVPATATGTLLSGVERVLSVLTGVAIALAFAYFVGLTWWSLAILVAAAIVVGILAATGALPALDTDTNLVQRLYDQLPGWLR